MNALILVAMMGILGNTPPPPYTDPQLTTTNALGGVADTYACTENVTTTLKDVLKTSVWSAVCLAAPLTTANAVAARIYTVKMLTAGAATSRVCLALGGTLNAATCTDVTVAGDSMGCSLVNAGDVCQWTIRPQASGCTSWDSCHLILLAKGSASVGAAAMVEVTVSQ